MIPLCANMLYFIHLWALASTHQSSVDLSSRLSEMASCIRIQGHTYRKSIQILSCLLITSSKPSDALMCKYTRPSLAQMMDLHLWRHYPNQNWIITNKSISIIPQCTRQISHNAALCNRDVHIFRNIFQWHLYQSMTILIPNKHSFEKGVWKWRSFCIRPIHFKA